MTFFAQGFPAWKTNEALNFHEKIQIPKIRSPDVFFNENKFQNSHANVPLIILLP